MNFSRRCFLASLGAAAVVPRTLGGEDRPSLRVGIVSDTHLTVDPRTAEPLFKAFTRFARESCSVVCISGDLCDEGTLDELRLLMSTWRRAFPGGRNASGGKVTSFFVFGNHDYHASGRLHVGKPITDADRAKGILFHKEEAWKIITGEEIFPGEIYSREIDGTVFIGAHWSHEKELPDWLEAHRGELPKDRPIVYVQHPHPKGTCFGGRSVSSDRGVTRDALMKWPNIIVVSGHSHISVSYDDGLWSGGFVSMGAGSTLRTGARNYEYNGSISGQEVKAGKVRHMSGARSGGGQQSTVLSIFPDKVTFSRWEHKFDERLGEDWELGFPFRHDAKNPFIAREAAAPEFPAGAKAELVEAEGKTYPDKKTERQFHLKFPCASSVGPHSRVVDYAVDVRKADGSLLLERLVQQEFASLAEKRTMANPGWCAFGPDELPRGEKLTFSITPMNAVGRKGRRLDLHQTL